MENITPLQSYSLTERKAYIQAIASIATADRAASPEVLSKLTR